MFFGLCSIVGFTVGSVVEACEAMALGAGAAAALVKIIKGR